MFRPCHGSSSGRRRSPPTHHCCLPKSPGFCGIVCPEPPGSQGVTDSYPVRNLTRSRAIQTTQAKTGIEERSFADFFRYESLLYLEGDRQGWTRDAKPNSFLQVSGSMIHSEEAFAANFTLFGKKLAVCPWSQGFLSRNPHL